MLVLMLLPAYAMAQNAAQTSPQTSAPQTSAPQTSAQSSTDVMMASVDKQKSAVQVQVGNRGAGDAFFSTPWTSAATIPVPAVIPACYPMADDDLKPFIDDSAKAQNLKPELIRAVIRRESESYPCAVSDKGAIGLMQLMPEVAQQFNVDPLDPRQNVKAGSQYLKQLITRYKGDLKLALAAYNAGPQRVDSGNKVPDIPETTEYVAAILKDLSTNTSPQAK
jgi:soluble lytic murein transglycosylase-like protein